MIQIGPLKLSDVLVAAMGIKEGKYRRLSSGEELIIEPAVNTTRFNFKLESWKAKELFELLRNNQVQSLPLYTAHDYLSGNYALKTLRETPLNIEWSNFELIAERTSEYVQKLQDVMVRQDDWTVLLKEDWESATSPYLALPQFKTLHDISATSNVIASGYGVVAVSGVRVLRMQASGYTAIGIFGTNWRNYHYSAWVQCNDNKEHGIIWRAEKGNIEGYRDDWIKDSAEYAQRGRHYRLVVDTTNNAYVITYHNAWGSGDIPEVIWTQQETSLGVDTWYHLAVICVGDTHYCFANGQLIHYFEDVRCKGGVVGFIMDTTAAGDYLYVDDILVHEVPYVPLVLDESHTEPSASPLKTRETPRGTIGYYDRPDVTYKMNKGGSNCMLHLRFDQPYGSKVFDLSGNSNHGKVVGGVWSNSGYMSFDRPSASGRSDGTYLRIAHNSSLNTDSEGTLIIRMKNRLPYGAGGFTQNLISKGNGAWVMRVDYASELAFCIDEDGPCSAQAIHTSSGEFEEEFKTYVVRWKKAAANMNMYKNGRLIGAPTSNSWTTDGHETSDDLLIGNANVDIEYVLLYDKYLEIPDLPDSFGVRLMDADSHHEHEVFDTRFSTDLDHTHEYWSDIAWSFGNRSHIDDLSWGQDNPLLYRRGVLCLPQTTSFALLYSPDWIKSLDKADFTVELVLTHNNTTTSTLTNYEMFSITNSAGTIETFMFYLYRGATGPAYLRCSVETSSGTEVNDLFPLAISGSGTKTRVGSVIQVVFKAEDRSLTAYWNGKKAGTATLAGDIDGTELTKITVGRHAGDTGSENIIVYRVRIIATALTRQEVKEIYHDYDKSPVQVFGQHEFEGYPELNNGLLSLRQAAIQYNDEVPLDEICDRPLFEIYDNGTYLIPTGQTELAPGERENRTLDFRHSIDDETDTYKLSMFEVMPVVRSISQDHVEIEIRNQFKRRDQYLTAQGIHTRRRIELALGTFAIDTEMQISTRTSDWKFYLMHNSMELLWQEASYIKYQETSGDEIWRTCISCNRTGASAKTIDGAPSTPYFSNYTILGNWNYNDYALGIMMESMDDHMHVDIAADDWAFWEEVYFDGIKGSKLRTVIALVPLVKENIYKTENDWTLSNFTVQTSQAEFIDDNNLVGDKNDLVATAYKSFSYEPGIYRLFFNFIFTASSNFIMKVYDGSGDARSTRRQRMDSGFKTEQMWFDLDLVVNATSAENLNTKLTLKGSDNSSSNTAEFDGVAILPLWNGADFILDQLYLARQLKLTRRQS